MNEPNNPREPTGGQPPENGGLREGAGRKINNRSKGTIKAGELRDKLLRTGETPLEVLVDGMRQARNRHAKVEAKLEAFNLETLTDPEAIKELNALIRSASAYLSEARECAKDAAPYLHPKLEPMGRFLELELPTIKGADDIAEAQAVVIGAMSCGEITTDEAAKISGILEARRKSIETVDIMARIAALEADRR